MSRPSDRIFGIAMALLAIAIYAGTLQFRQPFGGGGGLTGPRGFPQLIAAGLGIFGLWLAIRPSGDAQWPSPRRLGSVALAAAMLLGFAYFIRTLGFIPTSLATIAVIAVTLGARPLNAILCGLFVAIGLFFFFDVVLDLPLPAGVLGFLL